mgnify:CR=1 FL=1
MKQTPSNFLFEDEVSERLDKFLALQLSAFSRIQVQAFIKQGLVKVGGVVIQKPSFKLKQGQVVQMEVPIPPVKQLQAENIQLDILFQDENTVVINKPAGMIVHPGAGHTSGTVVNAALFLWPEMREVGEPDRPGVVHRLDRETSGVLVLARTQKAYHWFVKQFKARKTEKTYLALVEGQPPTPAGRIEVGIMRDPNHRQLMAAAYKETGRKAVSEYHTVQNYTGFTLLEVHPLTGRTHQIRVHLAYIGCPVVGDRVYGRKKPTLPVDRFFLHAEKLKIALPDEKALTEFFAPLPADLKTILDTLKKVD